jgi:hypothetical protein
MSVRVDGDIGLHRSKNLVVTKNGTLNYCSTQRMLAFDAAGETTIGSYGGAQGEGGLENVINQSQGFGYVALNNYFGDVLGTSYLTKRVNSDRFIIGSYGSVLGGYGYEVGSPVCNLLSQWRSRYLDMTGLIYKGVRFRTTKAAGSFPGIRSATMRVRTFMNIAMAIPSTGWIRTEDSVKELRIPRKVD